MKLEYQNLLLIVAGVFGVCGVILLPTIAAFAWGAWNKMGNKIDSLNENVMEFKVIMNDFKRWTEKLPKMESDINVAHDKIRDIREN